jgi:hypothetical protein
MLSLNERPGNSSNSLPKKGFDCCTVQLAYEAVGKEIHNAQIAV